MSDDPTVYAAPDIRFIEAPVEAVRQRIGMYLGNLEDALEHMIMELIANPVDLCLLGLATFVGVKFDGNAIEVWDDGPGFPFEVEREDLGINTVTMFFTHIHASPTADGHAPHVHIAEWGVGVMPVNAASARLEIKSWRLGKLWYQAFERGVPLAEPVVLEEGEGVGTTIRFIPDVELLGEYGNQFTLDKGQLRQRLYDTAHIFHGLTIYFQDEEFSAKQGLLSFLKAKCPRTNQGEPWVEYHEFLETDEVDIEIAVLGSEHSDTETSSENAVWTSWANGLQTVEHGTHLDGAISAFDTLGVEVGFGAIHVIMRTPQYAGPTRDKLNVDFVEHVVRAAVLEAFGRLG